MAENNPNILRLIKHLFVGKFSIDEERTDVSTHELGGKFEEYILRLLLDMPEGNVKEFADKVLLNYGEKNHPPDILLKGENGVAIEIKKKEPSNKISPGDIALNSSYPRSSLYFDDEKLTAKSKTEAWERKDMVYILGAVNKGIVKSLGIFYGDCFLVETDTYKDFQQELSKSIDEENLRKLNKGFSRGATKEIARFNKLDYSNSYLRVRPMWVINPVKYFIEIYENFDSDSFLHCVISQDTFEGPQFSKEDVDFLHSLEKDGYLSIEKVAINKKNDTFKTKNLIFIQSTF